ncbi:MAG: kynureninase [Cytophagales bacterium]|nr:MAG: kynureninase [Cytophagales bacterium]
MIFENTIAYAQKMDDEDILKSFKNRFHIPIKNGNKVIYFCGNSLGLQANSTSQHLEKVLNDWANMGVEGHFMGDDSWATYHLKFQDLICPLLGALPNEIAVMNSLTANLHIMLAAFYRPNNKRFKIITESRNFSSDLYALSSQVELHGLKPEQTIIEIPPSVGSDLYDEEKIIQLIEANKDSLSLVFLSTVNYYTGQKLRVEKIAKAAKAAGAIIGLDLAHAIGNVSIELHKAEVDFAVWCSYKYLNAGPGGVGGLYVHEKHTQKPNLIRPSGWWGNRSEDRFKMNKNFIPSLDANGFQLSNAPVISMAVQLASLQVFQEAGFNNLLYKSQHLTSYLLFLLKEKCIDTSTPFKFKIITPLALDQRGAQVSILVIQDCPSLYELIKKNEFVIDMRANEVLRITPVPLYNTFEEVYQFVEFFKKHAHLIQ